MKRKGMDFAIAWLVIIGPILIGLAGGIWYGSGRTPALWVGFAGIVMLMIAGALQLWPSKWKSQESVQQSNIIFTPDPTTAVFTRVHVVEAVAPPSIFEQPIDPRLGTVVYEVGNLGWDDDMRTLHFSLWALVSGQLVIVHQRQADFLAKGESIVIDNLPRPFVTGRMVVCVSYEFKGRKVNVVDFYTNENMSSSRGYAGQMNKLRESLKQVDGPNDLCRSMPGTATPFI